MHRNLAIAIENMPTATKKAIRAVVAYDRKGIFVCKMYNEDTGARFSLSTVLKHSTGPMTAPKS